MPAPRPTWAAWCCTFCSGSLTVAAVAERVMAPRGLGAASEAVLAAIEGSARRALRHQRTLGTVRNPRKEGRLALWELAG
ncbi:hypothetical protein GCM10009416_07140 [Craurococcus roseus]|uniref:Uncharacterized protein n=2 Tax=Craurococcus roseus TaxID=77585 RepID=A0ABN1EPK0_9PROT